MAVTAENSRLNLRTAAANVRARLGLPESKLSWTYEQRVEYSRNLAAEILRYPQSFDTGTVDFARIVANTTPSGLADTGFDWAAFGEETASNVVPTLDGFTNKLLLVLAIGVAVWAAVHAFRSTPPPSHA